MAFENIPFAQEFAQEGESHRGDLKSSILYVITRIKTKAGPFVPAGEPVAELFESAYGYKQTSSRPKSTSALPPTSDIPAILADFRF